jgi:hypothetical protein
LIRETPQASELPYLVDLGQHLYFRSMQYSQSQADHLHVFASSSGADVPGLRSDIVDDGLLQPGDQEVCAFIDNPFLGTSYAVEDDCSCSTSYIV